MACMRGTQDCPCANTIAVDIKSGTFYFTYWEPGAKQADCLAMRYSEYPEPTISTIWRNSSLPGGSASSPDISSDRKRIYVNDNNGGLHAIDAKTGKTIWVFNIGYATGGSQSTSPDGIIVPAGGHMAPLLCLQDKGDRAELLWRMDTIFNRGIATQTAGGLIYATVADTKKGRFYNRLAVIEGKSGKLIDEEPLPGITLFTVGTTIGPQGNVYVPTFNGILFAFSAEK
jgi:outer membrane protein assembly factor BamB